MTNFSFPQIPEVINITDLGEWIAYCDNHEVPYIPIEEIGGCCGELLLYLSGEFDIRTSPLAK